MVESDSTVAGIGEQRRPPVASRAFNVLLLLVCVAGAVGLLGGRTASAADTDHGYRLHLEYPWTIRPGLDALWKLTIVHPGGFGKTVTLAVTASYFDLFETQGWYPDAAESTTDGRYVYLTFDAPKKADTMTVRFDSYLQPYVPPTSLLGNDALVAVMGHGKRLATVRYTTWVLP